MHVCSVVFDSLCAPCTAVHQAAMSVEFSRQEYHWSVLPFLLLGICLTQGSDPRSLASPALQVYSLHEHQLGSPLLGEDLLKIKAFSAFSLTDTHFHLLRHRACIIFANKNYRRKLFVGQEKGNLPHSPQKS